MRSFALALTILLLAFSGCSQPPASSATRPATSSLAAPLAGHWTGSASVVVQWAQQKQLPIVLDIAPDGAVSGTVGDARLVDAKLASGRGDLGRALNFARDFRIHGRLEGDLIAAEKIRRDAVDIVFDRATDGTLVGGLTSSGSEFGGKTSMKLAAGKMVLKKS
jgi:hypothetical protein